LIARQHVLDENVSDVEGFCQAQDVPRAGAALVVFRSATPRLAEVNELWTGDEQIEPARGTTSRRLIPSTDRQM